MKPQEPKPLINENVSRIVNILLARDELRKQDLALGLDYDPGTITRAMQGKRSWTLDDLVAMAEFFEVPVSLFFEEPDSLVRSKYSLLPSLVSA